MKFGAVLIATVAAYDTEWAEFQAVQGGRNGDIPEAFKANVDYVKKFNAEHENAKLSYTGPFAAMSNAEYKDMLGFKPVPSVSLMGDLPKLGSHEMTGSSAPESMDWDEQGMTTPPKNQGHAQSCWSFSSTGALEGAWAIASGQLESLSEQQLIDCSDAGSATQGGLMAKAYDWYSQTGAAVASEESYPYTGTDDSCSTDYTTVIPSGGVTGYKAVESEDALLDAVANVGPVAVAIEADQQAFQLYESGVLVGECGNALDHGVTVTGYGAMDGQDYWKIKNSWGESWGLKGYILIPRGVGSCGITETPFPGSEACYPTVSASLQV